MVNQMIKIPRGCVLWLDLTEDTGNIVYDHSGHGNNGKVKGAVLEKRLPYIGRRFDGVDDLVVVADSESLHITKAITVVAWVKTKVVATQCIAHKYSADEDAGFQLFITSAGKAVLNGRDGSGYYRTSGESTTIVTDGNLHQIIGRINVNLWEIWVDGVKENYTDTGYQNTDLRNTVDLYIGTYSSYYFTGLISVVQIYNRALSASEIKYLYEEFQKRVFRRIAPLEIRMR